MSLFEVMAGRTIAAAARIAARRLDLEVHGAEYVPASGPVLIVARHYHHLYDGVALLAAVRRRLHLVVALDWARTRTERTVMEWATRAARWPALLRDDALAACARAGVPSAFRPEEPTRYRMRAIGAAVDLLAEGAVVVVFPEGYPNLDPRYTPKTNAQEMLPFRPGFTLIQRMASRRAGVHVPIVPAGLAYEQGERWRVAVRFGRALPSGVTAKPLVRLAEVQVAGLSRPGGPIRIRAGVPRLDVHDARRSVRIVTSRRPG